MILQGGPKRKQFPMKSTLFIFLIKIFKNNIKKITTAQIIGHGVLHAKNIMNTINFFLLWSLPWRRIYEAKSNTSSKKVERLNSLEEKLFFINLMDHAFERQSRDSFFFLLTLIYLLQFYILVRYDICVLAFYNVDFIKILKNKIKINKLFFIY